MKKSKQLIKLPRSQKQLKRMLEQKYLQGMAETEAELRKQFYFEHGKYIAWLWLRTVL